MKLAQEASRAVAWRARSMGQGARSRGAGRGFPLRIFPYTPCSLIAPAHLQDVAAAPRADIIFCSGTRIRAASGEPYRVQSLARWASVTPRVVTGSLHQPKCQLFDHLGSKNGKKRNFLRAAQDRIACRGGAVILRNGGTPELAPVCFCALPTSGNRKDVNSKKAASVDEMRWVSSMMRESPHRVLPVVEGDVDTWIGRRGQCTEAMKRRSLARFIGGLDKLFERHKRRDMVEREARLLRGLSEACRRGAKADIHRLCLALSRRGKGAVNRRFRHINACAH